jgi:hypothetical protein
VFLARTEKRALFAVLFGGGVRARSLLTCIGISRAVTMSTEEALDWWFARQPTVGELVSVLAAMFERDAARALGLAELYDEMVTESESYDGDPAPVGRQESLTEPPR